MAQPDYCPLIAGLSLEYATSSGTLKVEILNVAQRGRALEARCRQTANDHGNTEETELIIKKDSSGVYANGVKELPIPPILGDSWNVSPIDYEISALDAEVTVGAGAFKNCLKVSYRIGAGDGGGGEKFYAPGVGLVFENCRDESSPFEMSLTRFTLPEGK